MSAPKNEDEQSAGTQASGRGWLTSIIGPPVEALLRAWRAFKERLAMLLGRASGFWRFLFLGPEPDEAGVLTPPTKTALLLASAVLALTSYTWPLPYFLPPWLFVPLTLLVLLLAFRAIQYASVRGSGHRWEHQLRESERRAGLVWWERLGLLLSMAGTGWAFISQPTVIPLTAACAVGFLVLLGQPPLPRETRTVQPLTPLPPPLPTHEGDGEGTWTTTDGYAERRFAWTVRHALASDSHDVTLYLHEDTYATTRSTNPGARWDDRTPLFSEYIVTGTTPDIERAAATLRELADDHSYCTYEEISLALSFVQSIEYSLDEDSTGKAEYWRYPIETLYDKTGDCEDTTILAAALLRRLGHRVATLLLPEHAALAVEVPKGLPGRFVEFQGKRMYFCETTAAGWAVGEIPDNVGESDMKIFAVPE